MNSHGYTYGNTFRDRRWAQGTPMQTRAADTAALGSLEGSTLHGATILPAPGAPEPIGVSNQAMQAMGGCSCSGQCGCGDSGDGLSGFVDSIPGGYVTLGVAAVAAYLLLRKRGRRSGR